MTDFKLFSGNANPVLSKRIADYLGVDLGKITIGTFPDGETSCKIDEDVRGRDVYLIQPTCPPANEHLMQLLVMIDSCKRASAERVTAVMPYGFQASLDVERFEGFVAQLGRLKRRRQGLGRLKRQAFITRDPCQERRRRFRLAGPERTDRSDVRVGRCGEL